MIKGDVVPRVAASAALPWAISGSPLRGFGRANQACQPVPEGRQLFSVALGQARLHAALAALSMTSTYQPHSWSEFAGECLLYFAVMGVLHLAIFAVVCLVLGALAIRQRGTFLRRVGRFGLFMGLLLIVGSIFNGVWSCVIWGRLYLSADYTFDFSPFWPISQKTIDAPIGDMRGELFGVSLFQLQLVWLLFASGTWAVAIVLYRLVCRRPPAASGNSRRAGQLTGL